MMISADFESFQKLGSKVFSSSFEISIVLASMSKIPPQRIGAFGEVGHNAWFATGVRRDFSAGVLNIGVGGEYRFHEDKVRMSISGGSSTLLFESVLDPAGTTGWYAAIKPASA